MSTHPRVRLDCLASTIESGFPCSKSKLVETGLLHLRPFNIGSNGQLCLDEEYRVPFEIAPMSKNFLHTGDLLFNNTNSPALVGKVAVIGDDLEAGFSNHLTRIRVDTTRCEPAFVAAHIRQLWLHGYFRDNCTQWVSQAGFGTRLLASVRIPLPSLDEQRRIVGILNRAARIELLRAEARERLREFIHALFVKMFGDPATNPMGWPKKRLGQLCIRTEQRNPGNQPEKKFRYVDISGIDSIGKRINAFSLISGSDAPTRARRVIQANDVLVSSVRPNLNAVAIVPSDLDGEVASTGFCVLRANRDSVDPVYLFSCATSQYFIDTMVSKARGANYPSVSDKDIKDIRISLPPLHLQERFAEFFRAAQGAVTHTEIGNRTTIALTSSLMSRLLAGRA